MALVQAQHLLRRGRETNEPDGRRQQLQTFEQIERVLAVSPQPAFFGISHDDWLQRVFMIRFTVSVKIYFVFYHHRYA